MSNVRGAASIARWVRAPDEKAAAETISGYVAGLLASAAQHLESTDYPEAAEELRAWVRTLTKEVDDAGAH